jgi:hypothetical protein
MKSEAADTSPVLVNHTDLVSSRPLKNWKHEKFAVLVVAGTDSREAYTLAGFAPNRANHNRLIRQPNVKSRIYALRCERELAARAARVPLDQVLAELDGRGIIRIDDLFERSAAGIVNVRDLKVVPVEVAIAFLRALGDGFGVREK